MRIRGYHATYKDEAILREGFRPGQSGVWGAGTYLALDTQTAGFYHYYPDKAILSCEATISRPLCVTLLPDFQWGDYGRLVFDALGIDHGGDWLGGPGITDALRAHGYDSVIVHDLYNLGEPDPDPGGNQICVLNSAAVKVLGYHHKPVGRIPEPDIRVQDSAVYPDTALPRLQELFNVPF